MFRGLKVWRNKRKRIKKTIKELRDIVEIVEEKKNSQKEHLRLDRIEDELAMYYKGRYEAFKWMLKEK